MWACLDKVKEGLNLLRHYIDGLDQEDRLLGVNCDACGEAGPLLKEFQEHFRSKNNKAQYDYNTIIVSLYGYLERYIEDLIGEHLDQLSSLVSQFVDLPHSIQKNHLMLSLDLTRRADYQRYASSVKADDIIAKLHSCFTTPSQYQLNVQ